MGIGGVLFFFVHTSLVLMFSLERLQDKLDGVKLFLGFMIRRCFRIYPLSLLAVLTVFFLRLPLGHLVHGRLEWVDVSHWGLISNLLLTQNLTNSKSVLSPLWSLPYEIQMYVFLPLLYLFARRTRSLWPLLGMWAGSVGLALAHQRWGHIPDIVKYVPCFLCGVIAYKALETARPRRPFYGWALLPLLVTFLFGYSRPYEKGWLMCLVVGLGIPQFTEMSNPWLKKICQMIARYSYGIYLLHYVSIWLAFVVLRSMPAMLQWVVLFGSLAAMTMLAYHTIEVPLIRVGGSLVDWLFTERTAARVLAPQVVEHNAWARSGSAIRGPLSDSARWAEDFPNIHPTAETESAAHTQTGAGVAGGCWYWPTVRDGATQCAPVSVLAPHKHASQAAPNNLLQHPPETRPIVETVGARSSSGRESLAQIPAESSSDTPDASALRPAGAARS